VSVIGHFAGGSPIVGSGIQWCGRRGIHVCGHGGENHVKGRRGNPPDLSHPTIEWPRYPKDTQGEWEVTGSTLDVEVWFRIGMPEAPQPPGLKGHGEDVSGSPALVGTGRTGCPVREIFMPNYSMRLAWSLEDQLFAASDPELGNLSAHGANPREAVALLAANTQPH